MRELALAGRYAEALFLAAKERGALDAVAEDVSAILELIQDRRLVHFLESPMILDEEKERVVRSIFGERTHPLVVDLVLLLLDKQRVPHLQDILEVFLRRLDEHRGILEARVITAVAIQEDTAEHLRRKLELKTGLRLRLKREVDPRLIGGVMVVLGNRIIDGTLRHSLRKMKQFLLEAAVHQEARG